MVRALRGGLLKVVKEKVLLVTVIFASIIFSGVVYQISLQSNLTKSETLVKDELSRLKEDLPSLIHHDKNIKLTKRLSETLRNKPITGYEIFHNDKMIEAWTKEGIELSSCENPINTFLTQRAMYVGKITTCLSKDQIVRETLASPFLMATLAISVIFMLIVAFLPLFSHKKSILALFEWRKDPTKEIQVNENDEIAKEIATSIREFHANKLELEQTKIEYEMEKEIIRITKQVSHDIEGPTGALQMAINTLDVDLPHENRELIENSLERILNVSSDLKQKNKGDNYTAHIPKVHKISKAIDQIVKEKKALNKAAKFNIEIGEELKAYCVPSTLQRILSNLINNSIEACEGRKPKITIKSLDTAKLCKLVIEDNGKGIPPEALPHVFEEKFSHGKDEGLGLGLHHAEFKLESWGGSINILESNKDGTKIEISMIKKPKTKKVFNEATI